MARNLLRLAPEPAGIGVAVGSRINLTNLGMFGFAAMASGTLRELISDRAALLLADDAARVDPLVEGPADCEITIDASHLPRRRPPVLHGARYRGSIVATVPSFVHPVLSRHADEIRVELAADEEYLRPLLERVAIRRRTSTVSAASVRAPARDARRTAAAGRRAHARVCVAAVRADSRAATAPTRAVGAGAARNFFAAPGEMPGLDAVAASLHVHPRTLAPSARGGRHLVSRADQRRAGDVGRRNCCLRSG